MQHLEICLPTTEALCKMKFLTFRGCPPIQRRCYSEYYGQLMVSLGTSLLSLSIMAINRLGSHTGKKRHTSSVRLAEFYLNPFTFVGYGNNSSCLSLKSLYFERYATVPIVIFLNMVKFFMRL